MRLKKKAQIESEKMKIHEKSCHEYAGYIRKIKKRYDGDQASKPLLLLYLLYYLVV